MAMRFLRQGQCCQCQSLPHQTYSPKRYLAPLARKAQDMANKARLTQRHTQFQDRPDLASAPSKEMAAQEDYEVHCSSRGLEMESDSDLLPEKRRNRKKCLEMEFELKLSR